MMKDITSLADLEKKSGPELVALYNAEATLQGKPMVKKFSDRTVALKRCWALHQATITKGPPEIAEGAYQTATEAEFRTGISPRKRRNPKKKEAAKERKSPIAAPPSRTAAKNGPKKQTGDGLNLGGYRLKLFETLKASMNTYIDRDRTAITAVYGSALPANPKAAFTNVAGGLESQLKKHTKLELRSRRSNVGGKMLSQIGLFTTGAPEPDGDGK